jgi:hypothetical protein
MTSEKCVEVVSFPPAYDVSGQTTTPVIRGSSKKSKALFGYAVGATTALVVVLVLGGVYYYKSIDVLQETIKKFHLEDTHENNPVKEDVEIDMANNYAVFYMTGPQWAPGTFLALDYTKSMIGIYDPKLRLCYLIGGIDSKINDLQTFSLQFEMNTTYTDADRKKFYYVLSDNYPVSDKKILPYHLKSACTSLPVYWIQPAPAQPLGIQKGAPSGSYHFGEYCTTVA